MHAPNNPILRYVGSLWGGSSSRVVWLLIRRLCSDHLFCTQCAKNVLPSLFKLSGSNSQCRLCFLLWSYVVWLRHAYVNKDTRLFPRIHICGSGEPGNAANHLPLETKLPSLHSQAPLEHEYVYIGRAWYLLSCEHDIIEKRPEFLEQTTFCAMFNQLSVLRSVCMAFSPW